MNKLSILLLTLCSGFILQAAESKEDADLRRALEMSRHSQGEDAELRRAMELSKQEAEQAKARAKAQHESKGKRAAVPFKSLPVEKITLHASIQEGADCAYDASKNAVLTVKWLDGKFGSITQPVFERDYLKNPHHFPLVHLHRAIERHRRGGSIAFLDNEEVEAVILPILTEGFIAKGKIPAWFTVIPNVAEASENFDYILIMEDWVNAIKKIRSSEIAIHGFIINDARETGAPTGHWVAVVVHKTLHATRYYIIDSMAGYKEKYKDIPASELKMLETETHKRVGALQRIIEKLPV